MFKNLYSSIAKIGFSAFVLSIAGANFVNAQQWQNVGNTSIGSMDDIPSSEASEGLN